MKLVRTTSRQRLPPECISAPPSTATHAEDQVTLSKDITYVEFPSLPDEQSSHTTYIPMPKPVDGEGSDRRLENVLDEVEAMIPSLNEPSDDAAGATCRDEAVSTSVTIHQVRPVASKADRARCCRVDSLRQSLSMPGDWPIDCFDLVCGK